MDPNLLKDFDYCSAPGNQSINVTDQGAQTSPGLGHGLGGQTTQELWNIALGTDSGIGNTGAASGATSSRSSFAQTTPLASNAAFGAAGGPSLYGESKAGFPQRSAQPVGAPRKREGNERKRAKVASEATGLDSADFWLQFDDDDADKAMQSFEIDYSKRRNNRFNQMNQRCVSKSSSGRTVTDLIPDHLAH